MGEDRGETVGMLNKFKMMKKLHLSTQVHVLTSGTCRGWPIGSQEPHRFPPYSQGLLASPPQAAEPGV